MRRYLFPSHQFSKRKSDYQSDDLVSTASFVEEHDFGSGTGRDVEFGCERSKESNEKHVSV